METDPVPMWVCGKYGVSMMSVNAPVFCARRYAFANGLQGEAAQGFDHCRTCKRGAREYSIGRRRHEGIMGQSGRGVSGKRSGKKLAW